MATEFECKTGDKGVCSIPDPTAVIVGGRVLAASARDVARLLSSDRLESMQIEAVGAVEDRDIDAFGLERTSVGPSDDGVIANCTCGHIYIIRSGNRS